MQQLTQRTQLNRTGTVALMNLPAHSSLCLDGSTNQILRQEEPILILENMPIGFHLLVIRAGSTGRGGDKDKERGNEMMEALLHSTATLLLLEHDDVDKDSSWFLARQYDAQTEELSPKPLDKQTYDNLREAYESKTLHKSSRVVDYKAFFQDFSSSPSTSGSNCKKMTPVSWDQYLTKYISREVLRRHELSGKGDKIVPGTYTEDKEETSKIESDKSNIVDGVSLSFPPIPCFFFEQQEENQERVRVHSHSGTRQFLANLSPSDRTALFLSKYNNNQHNFNEGEARTITTSTPQTIAFSRVLKDNYNGRWDVLLGEWQLSFAMFVSCACLSSLEHWRDTLVMLSLVDHHIIESYSDLYEKFLQCIKYQLSSFDISLFEDADYSKDNVLIPALQRICATCTKLKEKEGSAIHNYAQDMYSAFPHIVGSAEDQIQQQDGLMENLDGTYNNNDEIMDYLQDDDEEDEDGPVIVSLDDVEASIARSVALEESSTVTSHNQKSKEEQYHKYHSDKYPLLFAAILNHEDIVMACARILDEKPDVSLVREAAAYLEEVEAHIR